MNRHGRLLTQSHLGLLDCKGTEVLRTVMLGRPVGAIL